MKAISRNHKISLMRRAIAQFDRAGFGRDIYNPCVETQRRRSMALEG